MRNDVEPIDGGDAGALAVGQAQAAPDRLFDQDARIGGAQRHDGVEVGDIPAFFEHVDMNDDLGWLVGALDVQQPGDHGFFFRAGFA